MVDPEWYRLTGDTSLDPPGGLKRNKGKEEMEVKRQPSTDEFDEFEVESNVRERSDDEVEDDTESSSYEEGKEWPRRGGDWRYTSDCAGMTFT